jgi:hypothetical protein
MKKLFLILICACISFGFSDSEHVQKTNPPIYIAFLWHMHQPIYWPYESVVQTDANVRYSYSLTDIHNQRMGPYTTWPKDAVQKGINAGLSHFGAQVSFSGSLIENLNNIELNGNGNFQNWKSNWNYIKSQTTSAGNPRIDMVGFGYHHPLMALIDYADVRKQIQKHRQIFSINFPGNYSKGFFPPENAFSERMIPALKDEGIEWVLIDNVHFERTCEGFPFSTSGNLYEPNKADVQNTNPNDWLQLNGLWAPTKVSARWSRQPHFVEYTDPTTGIKSKIIAVPADRYLGNEDGRGGFGALNYETVMSQLESFNTDPNHPMLIVLAHDGDNYGGGSESYYNNNFQNFVNWLQANPSRFVCSTIQDYLQMFPPEPNDIIHVEPGSWSGADNGDPEFKKWLGDPGTNNYSPDRNSWGVVTAAKNFVFTAEQINPNDLNTQNAWKYLLNAETSCYWYWDGSQDGIWDSHPTRACNQAIQYASNLVYGGVDNTPPTIFLPQREPYNPGATEWGISQPSNFKVWTYAYDVKGLKSVKLKFRTDLDGVNPINSTQNETYSGGGEVTSWSELSMTGHFITPETNPLPLHKAKEYSVDITGLNNVLVDYYVEAIDSNDNVSRSPIQHVWVGQYTGGGGGTTGVGWLPLSPTKNDTITITVSGATQGAKLHWGVNNSGSTWQAANSAYWPSGSSLFNGTGPAVESPMSGPDGDGKLTIKIGPFNNPAQAIARVSFVIHYDNNTWDNNGGSDYQITISDGTAGQTYIMDGVVDTSARIVSTNADLNLYLGWNGTDLYMATQSALSQGGDMFIFISDSSRALKNSPWVKSDKVSSWNAFLGNESTNNWCGWFNQTEGSLTTGVLKYAGNFLEGTLNVQTIFGYLPARLYISIGKYQTADAGNLMSQVPIGNGDANIDPGELYVFDYTFTTQPPSVPTLILPVDGASIDSSNLKFIWHRVSGVQTYHLEISKDSNILFIDYQDSTIVDTSKIVSTLNSDTSYYWRVQAKNSGGVSGFSNQRKFTVLRNVYSDGSIKLKPGWNMLSVPYLVSDWRKDALFPTSTSSGFSFQSAYVIKDTLTHGKGYWLKFSVADTVRLTGLPILIDTIDVEKGWNMIGTLSEPIHLNSVIPIPPLVLNPSFYTYDGSYFPLSDSLFPGKAYWLKVSEKGRIILKK